MTVLHTRAFDLVSLVWNLRIYISNFFPVVAAHAFGAVATPWEGTLDLVALNKLFSQLHIIGRKEKGPWDSRCS